MESSRETPGRLGIGNQSSGYEALKELHPYSAQQQLPGDASITGCWFSDIVEASGKGGERAS